MGCELLIYEKGSFFTAHRNTEKVPGMFATARRRLADHASEGGTLIVEREGQTRKIDFGGEDSEFQDAIRRVLCRLPARKPNL